MSPFQKTVLLVEDNDGDATLALYEFKRQAVPAHVVVARDGEEALKILRAGPPPDLVVLDLNLPKVDGFEVLKAIRASPELQQLRVIVLTSSLHDRDVMQASYLGANLFFQKPVSVDEFSHVVRQIKELLTDGT